MSENYSGNRYAKAFSDTFYSCGKTGEKYYDNACQKIQKIILSGIAGEIRKSYNKV